MRGCRPRRTDRDRAHTGHRHAIPLRERELLELGERVFDELKAGTIAIEEAPDQAAVESSEYLTLEGVVGMVLHGRLPHAFQVAVVEAWVGRSGAASATIGRHRDLFFAELLRLIPHEE